MQHTQLSNLTDDEYLNHLLNKKNPTAEDVESALRIEIMLGHLNSMAEHIHGLSTERRSKPRDLYVAENAETVNVVRRAPPIQ